MTTFISSRKSKKILSLLFWISVWHIIYKIIDKEILIVSPYATFKRISELIFLLDFWVIIINSVSRIFLGFFVALILGIIFASISKKISLIHILFEPLFDIIKIAPVASFIILTLIIMKSNIIPIFISFLIVLPISYINTMNGINSVDIKLLQMAKVFKFSKAKKIKYIYIPTVFPQLISTVKTGMGLAWKSGVAAEILCSPKYSIGGEIYSAKTYLKTEDVFAWTIVVIILSIIFEKIFIAGVNYVYRKNIKKI